MASCVAVAPDNTLFLDAVSSPDSCAYLLITNADYQANLNINALFAQYLAFDPVLSGTLLGAFIVSFVAGHVLGKVLAGLRRV
ncbi:hypothetical protein [Methylovulum miyakonense]|uniref:hypothetical protein n=1 Tax=Methylovulum miyakonense TaxID=645578 RepID=UPI00036E76DA|nr:hypothetical protein [Methylovulum miyakonense]